MSAILAVIGTGPSLSDGVVRRMLDRMRARGAGARQIWRDDCATLAVARHDWESESGLAGPSLVVESRSLVVVADCSLYYRDDLLRALRSRGVNPSAYSPADLVLAAYRAWGDDCVKRLEGDLAFVLWDRAARRLFCSRDFAGGRPLVYADLGHAMIVASTVGAVIEHPDCPCDVDLGALAECAAGLVTSHSPATAYRAVRIIPAGCSLSRQWNSPANVTRHWDPLVNESGAPGSFDDAAVRLRELLRAAVKERVPACASTAVWLSGGWDSTAVFASAQVGAIEGDSPSASAVAISYPRGDPGREDELITSVARRWGTPVHWLDIGDIRYFDEPGRRAESRDEPFAHGFEMWNRALARATVSSGARVALSGYGGDQLFQLSPVFFADLCRGGSWSTLAREWRAKGGRDTRSLWQWAIQPLLPPTLARATAAISRGRISSHHLAPALPPWMDRAAARRLGLEDRQTIWPVRPPLMNHAAFEMLWNLVNPSFPRVLGAVSGIALEEGVELRSPLYDRRVVEFAALRPAGERSLGAETKRLLRRAMRGLLPDHVLAPRPHRTGTPARHFHHAMRTEGVKLCKSHLERSMLAELGLIEPRALRRAASLYAAGQSAGLGIPLFFTLQTELWLKGHMGESRSQTAFDARESHLVAGVA